jgi:uncharacterized RDD family membrane protein YckC
MAVDQESVTRVLSALSHPTRRGVLLILNEKSECSFTDLMNALGVDTGKLSFHIRNLIGLVEQSPSGKYRLSKMGENAVRLVMDLQSWAGELSVQDRGSSMPVATIKKRAYAFLADFGIVFSAIVAASLIGNTLSFFTVPSGPLSVIGGVLSVSVIIFVPFFWVYSTLLEGFAGQSIGKKLLRLTVVRVDGKRMFYDHAAVRNFGKIFVLLPFDLLAGHRLKDRRFIRYFDKFARTTVIDLEPTIAPERSSVLSAIGKKFLSRAQIIVAGISFIAWFATTNILKFFNVSVLGPSTIGILVAIAVFFGVPIVRGWLSERRRGRTLKSNSADLQALSP